MNDINATIGLHNLPHIPDILNKNRLNASYYDQHLHNVAGVTLLKNNSKCKSAFWLYTFRVSKKHAFIEKMKEANIMVSQVHNRNDINSCVEDYKEVLPKLDILEKELVCIPVGWRLSENDCKYIVDCIKQGW